MQNYVLETAVFAKASADLSQLLYSHLGGYGAGNPAHGPPNERGRAVARLNRNIVYVVGDTESSDLIPLPTTALVRDAGIDLGVVPRRHPVRG